MSAIAIRYFGTTDDEIVIRRDYAFVDFHGLVRGALRIESGSRHMAVVMPGRSLGISGAQAQLDEMAGLAADWDALGSAPPNQTAKSLALLVLDKCFLMGFKRPSYVTASAEGGVGIVFRSDLRYAAIECLNSGEMWLLWYDEAGNPQTRQIENNSIAIASALGQVTALHANA